MWTPARQALMNAASAVPVSIPSTQSISLRHGLVSTRLGHLRLCTIKRNTHRWSLSRASREMDLRKDDKGESDKGSATMRRTNEGANVTLKDIPQGMRDVLIYKCMRQPVQILVGRKGVDAGLLNCLQMHFRTHEVVRCRVAKQWSDCVADLAQELEEKSGGVIIERAGSRICLFRGYTDADIPHKSHRPGRGWWQSSNEEHTPGTDAPARTPKAGTDWWNAYRENPDDMQGEAEQEEKDSV